MKKIALLLVCALLVCTCCALASCTKEEENTSSATSSAASEAASSAATSVAVSSDTASTATSEETSSEETSSEPETPAAPQMLWVTHYNTIGNEGTGAIMTEAYSGGAWWLMYSFKPIEGSDAFELVAISDGYTDGSGSALEIPEGGFVYANNAGNGDKATENNRTSTDRIRGVWAVGDRIVFTGIDLENATLVPTETPDLDCYNADYVCTATWAYAS